MRSADRVRKCLLFGVEWTYRGHLSLPFKPSGRIGDEVHLGTGRPCAVAEEALALAEHHREDPHAQFVDQALLPQCLEQIARALDKKFRAVLGQLFSDATMSSPSSWLFCQPSFGLERGATYPLHCQCVPASRAFIVAILATGAAIFQVAARLGAFGPGIRDVAVRNPHVASNIGHCHVGGVHPETPTASLHGIVAF
jgi:hypothetical protein